MKIYKGDCLELMPRHVKDKSIDMIFCDLRQLRNVAEQVSVLEQERNIDGVRLHGYLPNMGSNLPAVISGQKEQSDFSNEREILYKVLFDMKSDLNDLKKLTLELMKQEDSEQVQKENESLIQKIYGDEDKEERKFEERRFEEPISTTNANLLQIPPTSSLPTEPPQKIDKYHFAEEIEEEETLSLHDKELELIKKSLERHRGKRKAAADELGISERTLYRKIKQYDL